MRTALRTGLLRAGLHWIRAGYEVVSGVGALLEEIATSRRAPSRREPESPVAATRIELE